MMGMPEGWASTTLGEICTKPQYGWTTKASPREGSIKLVRTTDITKGRIDWKTVPFCTEGPEDEEKYRLRSGDIVISRAGSVGASMLLQDPIPRAVFASYLIRFRSRLGVDPRFVGFFLKSARYWAAVHGSASGIALPNVNAKKLAALDLPLPPLPEQHRIVARIESLFTELDEGVAALKRAEANLERYRASVLKAAVEGRLTEQWRRENPPEETGPELLGRVLTERRKCWEAEQLAKFAAKGRKPPRNWKAKYKEPAAPDTDTLPELPEGWCWATVDQVGQVGSGITKGGKKRDAIRRPVPYLRVANVQRGHLDLSVIKTILASDAEIHRYSLKSGDVLFNEGGDRDKLGRGWVWSGDLAECLHQNHVFRVRPFLRDYSSDFLSHYGNSAGQEWFFRRATQSVNLASINQTVLRSLPVPLPPLREQQHIVRRLANALENAETAGSQFTRQLNRATILRQSILKRAFDGRLVPQDPADEPTSVLLERIRAERQAKRKRNNRRRAKPKRKRRSQVP